MFVVLFYTTQEEYEKGMIQDVWGDEETSLEDNMMVRSIKLGQTHIPVMFIFSRKEFSSRRNMKMQHLK